MAQRSEFEICSEIISVVLQTFMAMSCDVFDQFGILPKYFLRVKKVGTLAWARPFHADASSTLRANEGPAPSAQPWALAELIRRKPFVDTVRLVVLRRNSRATK